MTQTRLQLETGSLQAEMLVLMEASARTETVLPCPALSPAAASTSTASTRLTPRSLRSRAGCRQC